MAQEPETETNASGIAHAAKRKWGYDAEQVDAFHAAGLANGGTACEDPPGIRNTPTGQLYLAYLRDPDGNKLCVACHVAES